MPHLKSPWLLNITYLFHYLLLSVFLIPLRLHAQSLMPIVDPDDYGSLVETPMLVRGAAPSTGFDEAFRRFQQADFDKAQDEIRKVIAQAEDRKDKKREGVARDFQGLIFQRQGLLDDAIQRHEAASLILEKEGESGRKAWANAANNLAVANYLKGRYEEAESWLKRVIKAVKVPPEVRARALNNHGLINQELGNLEQAIRDFADASQESTEDKTLQAQVKNNLARARALDGRYDDAIKRLQEAQKLAREVKDAALEANILDSWAETLLQAKRAKEALQKLGEAEKIEKDAQAPLIRLRIAWNRGRALAMLRRNDEAFTAYTDAIKNSGESKLPVLYRDALTSRGDLYLKNGKLNEAIADYVAGVKVAQTTRKGLSGQREKDFIQATQNLYEKVVKVFIQRGQPGDIDEALKYLDESKSDSLHRELVKANPKLRDKDLQKTLQGARGDLEKEEVLSRQLQEAMAKRTSSDVIAKLQTQLAEVRKRITGAYGEIMERYGEHFGEYVGVSPLLIGQLKDSLPAGHLLVTFLPTEEALYIFLVSKESGVEFRQNRKIKRKELDEKIRQYRKLVTSVEGSASNWRIDSWKDSRWEPLRKLTIDLYEAVLQPIADRVSSANAIVFAPTGLLYYLPLHALGPFDAKTGQIRFLILDKPVSYITTATYYKGVSSGPKTIHRTLLALGNPPFEKTLKPLPHAEEEVTAIATPFGKQSLVLKGPEATRQALLALLGTSGAQMRQELIAKRGPALVKDATFGFIHLATHGILDSRSPKESYLAMDGTNKLAAQDIPELDLHNASLVTLSACETGLAQDKPGGELMSMASFFAQAGTRSIAVTLWSVSDAATRDLMVLFYRDLLEQKTSDKSVALQKAQKTLASKPETRHPFFWAAFVLIGDWR